MVAMIAVDRFLFLHLHKSGGTFVNGLLLRHLDGRQIGYHLPWSEAPFACRHLPVLGTVRSPWSYYVSWYYFQRSRLKPNILFRLCSDGGSLGFADTVRRLVLLGHDRKLLEQVREGLPERFQPAGLNLTKGCLEPLYKEAIGFYTFLYQRLYAGAEQPIILRQEELRSGLGSALASFGYLPDPEIETYLAEAPPRNVSDHPPPAACYDPELAALVATHDRPVAERHGYTFADLQEKDEKGTAKA
jgi:hypothetical protein